VRRFALIAAALVLIGCRSTEPAQPAAASSSHVVVIVMENKEYGQVIGSPSSPYVNSLARRYASPTRFFGVAKPSLPNYFALTAGTTFGVRSNCTVCQQDGETIVDQLEAAGLSWRAYMGGMPRACFRGATSGPYAKKHNPFMYYRSVVASKARCGKVVPERRLSADLRAGRLPTYSFLTPDLCADTHDCPIATGDRYLSRVVPPLLRALGPRGFLVLTYDEGASNRRGGGHIPTVIAGPGVKRGARPAAVFDHYSTLRTIEDALGLEPLRRAAAARPLDAAFRRAPRLR
jgi:hypothetical protein